MPTPAKHSESGSNPPPAQRLALAAASEPGLRRVIERAQYLASLDTRLRQSLPTTLAEQCRLANVDDVHLVMLVSTPVWKAKLRQCGHLIEAAAAAAGLPARTLLVKVSPEVSPLYESAPRGQALSDVARESLRATAQSISDPELRAQLLRLAASR